MIVSLTADEAEAAWVIAKRRNSLNGGQTNLPFGETASVEERSRQHYVACLAEIAVAKVLNLWWTGCGKGATGLRDVGGFLEVRSVDKPELGLLVRYKDALDHPYMLVQVSTSRSCELLGWAYGEEVKRLGRGVDLLTDRPCWVLSRRRLRPLNELRIPLIEHLMEVAV